MPKVEVVIPRDLLREVDEAARQVRTDRSAFICRSLRSLLRTVRLQELRQQMLADARALAEEPRDGVNPEGRAQRSGAEGPAPQSVEDRTGAGAARSVRADSRRGGAGRRSAPARRSP